MEDSCELRMAADSLAQICQSISGCIESTYKEWYPDDPPSTVLFGEIGWRIAQVDKSIPNSTRMTLFSEIERFMKNGSETLQTAVATGLLEALLAAASSGTVNFDFSRIAACLGAQSRAHCHAWDVFTGIRTKGLW